MGGEIEEVWHLAASTAFDETKRQEIETSNINGTKNVLDFAHRFPHLDRFHYMSTSYISGKNNGTIPEDRVTNQNGFKNPYESSKFVCENLVRDSNLPFVIIRPSILIGDSKTGDPKGENRMFYGYLLTLYYSILHHFGGEKQFWDYWRNTKDGLEKLDVRLVGSPATTKNVVTIDDVVNLCMKIKEDNNLGKTYNLVNPRNITMEFATSAIQRALKVKGLKHDGALSEGSLDKDNKLEKIAYKKTRIYHPYMSISEPEWDYSNVSRLGAERVLMTDERFEFLMRKFVEKELIKNDSNYH